VSARELLWDRVNAALDAGRDPLEDVGVQQALDQADSEEVPELLDEVARLQRRLEGVARSSSDSRELLWERVHAALDAGNDPLDDAGVQEGLETRPELLVELARSRARLAAVGGVERGAVPASAGVERRRVRRRVAAAAALAFASAGLVAVAGLDSLGAWLAPRGGADDRGELETGAELASGASGVRPIPSTSPRASAMRSEVLAFTAEVVIEGPDGRSVAIFDGRDVRSSTQRSFLRSTSMSMSAAPPAPPDPVRFVAIVETLSSSR
jgi:hypothetical protein